MLSAAEYQTQKADLERQLREKQRAYDEAALGAIADASLVQQKDRLRTEVRSLDDALADLEAAFRAARAGAAVNQTRTSLAARKECFSSTVARLGEVGDLAGEIDDTVEHLRVLIERVRNVEESWQSRVYALLPDRSRHALDSIVTASMRPPLQQLEDFLRMLEVRPRAPEVRAAAHRTTGIVARALQLEGT